MNNFKTESTQKTPLQELIDYIHNPAYKNTNIIAEKAKNLLSKEIKQRHADFDTGRNSDVSKEIYFK